MIQALVERSRRIGADPALVLYGGGNTSSKLVERDHTGRERRVLRIKGSGSDLATCEPRDFPGLWLDDLLALRDRETMTDEEMVSYLARCLVEPDAPRPSIETLLHAFLPAASVDHAMPTRSARSRTRPIPRPPSATRSAATSPSFPICGPGSSSRSVWPSTPMRAPSCSLTTASSRGARRTRSRTS